MSKHICKVDLDYSGIVVRYYDKDDGKVEPINEFLNKTSRSYGFICNKNGFLKYTINTYDGNDEYILKIREEEIPMYYDLVQKLNEKYTEKVTKTNKARLVALASAGIIFAGSIVGIIAKTPKILKEEEQAWKEAHKAPDYILDNPNFSEEKKIEYQSKEYYELLKQRALAGDEDAIEELSQHLLEQSILENNEEEHVRTR